MHFIHKEQHFKYNSLYVSFLYPNYGQKDSLMINLKELRKESEGGLSKVLSWLLAEGLSKTMITSGPMIRFRLQISTATPTRSFHVTIS